MGTIHTRSDCKKHGKNAIKCKWVKAICYIDTRCAQYINIKSPKFDLIYDEIVKTYKGIDYYNAMNHCIKFHKNDKLLGYLASLIHKCELKNCEIFVRNYRRNDIKKYVNNYDQRKDNYNQMNFIQHIHSNHEWLCHHQDNCKYIKQKRSFLSNTDVTYYTSLTQRYIHLRNTNNNINDVDNKDNDNDNDDVDLDLDPDISFESDEKTVCTYQKFVNQGRSFNYGDKHHKFYVGCKYCNLKEEIIEGCSDIAHPLQWDSLMHDANKLIETDEIKAIKHRTIPNKSISVIKTLAFYMYTSIESFQQKLNVISRLSINPRISVNRAKKIHSAFGHSFKLIMEGIYSYGSLSSGNKIVYRGVCMIPLFRQYLYSCQSTTSTTTSYYSACNFSGLAGTVLQLNVPNNSMYLYMNFISNYKLEEELLFYGKYSYLEINMIQMIAIKKPIYLTLMVLLEQLTTEYCEYSRRFTKENELKYSKELMKLLLNNQITNDNDNDSISIYRELEHYISKKRHLYLPNAKLMRLICGNRVDYDIRKLLNIFRYSAYITIGKTYDIDIKYIILFVQNDTISMNDCKLRQIEYYHDYNQNKLNEIRVSLRQTWPSNCYWEPFYDSSKVIKFKKDIIRISYMDKLDNVMDDQKTIMDQSQHIDDVGVVANADEFKGYNDNVIVNINDTDVDDEYKFNEPDIDIIQQLTPRDILYDWLTSINLSQYYNMLIDDGWDDMEYLNTLTEQDLCSIGMNKKGHRRKLLRKIVEYYNGSHGHFNQNYAQITSQSFGFI